jgi:hypothetical protein
MASHEFLTFADPWNRSIARHGLTDNFLWLRSTVTSYSLVSIFPNLFIYLTPVMIVAMWRLVYSLERELSNERRDLPLLVLLASSGSSRLCYTQ